MKAYSYGKPRRDFVKLCARAVKKAPWLKVPLQLLVWLLAFAVLPAAWLLVKVGEVGHRIGECFGWETREWT